MHCNEHNKAAHAATRLGGFRLGRARFVWIGSQSRNPKEQIWFLVNKSDRNKGGGSMATFVMFGKYSQNSIKQISAKRTQKAKALIKKNGGEVKSGYALLGKVDLVLIVELPDTEKAMETAVGLSKLLGISFTTAPAVSMKKFDKLMGA